MKIIKKNIDNFEFFGSAKPEVSDTMIINLIKTILMF